MRLVRNAAAACVIAASLACGKSGEEVPPIETQTVTPPQAQATPERVTGCLRAGESDGTFILTASSTDTRMPAATYQLLGSPEGFRDHVGHRVEVTGTVIAEQTASAQGATMPAEERAKGTSGTPTVQSSTKIEVKRLQVASVTPVDGDCDDE